MDIFESCHVVNDLLHASQEHAARDELIKLLAQINESGLPYSPLVNALIRDVGLFPYMDYETCDWQERFVAHAFSADVGGGTTVTLHREQSRLLNALLAGESIAVSAPTSFGKSFVIDAFIATKRPTTVVILVPTIALADETRRRLERKFGMEYQIITTADSPLAAKNIFVFPQERVIGYLPLLEKIDILVVDEFYKASKNFDKERAPALIRAIVELTARSEQRYFLAPHVSELNDSTFTKDMRFLKLDFNTVFLNKTELYEEIGKDEQKKSSVLLHILQENPGKTLIYAGTYPNIQKLATLFIDAYPPADNALLNSFASWLGTNYDPNWELTKLVSRGIGVHNGQLHRSLSQIQVKLFEEPEGLDALVSTSSIIEGVNTSAENVILWSNKNGQARINDFTYRNIIGRGGRMFRHFIGKIFILEKPPAEGDTQLELEYPDELVGVLDENLHGIVLTTDQQKLLHAHDQELLNLVGRSVSSFTGELALQSNNAALILDIVRDMKRNPTSWNGLGYLNGDNPNSWDRLLYKIINLRPGYWDGRYAPFVAFVKILSRNWNATIPELLSELNQHEIGIGEFFRLERNVTFKLATLLGDVQNLYNRLFQDRSVDLSIAISRFSHAFLPPNVFVLEEYGVPRMISRKVHSSRLIDLEARDLSIHDVVERFRGYGLEGLMAAVGSLDDFDEYILKYFYDGITHGESS